MLMRLTCLGVNNEAFVTLRDLLNHGIDMEVESGVYIEP